MTRHYPVTSVLPCHFAVISVSLPAETGIAARSLFRFMTGIRAQGERTEPSPRVSFQTGIRVGIASISVSEVGIAAISVSEVGFASHLSFRGRLHH